MLSFSELEKDEKTFKYVREYIQQWNKNSTESFHKLDMDIQLREIIVHLYLNGRSSEDQAEAINWIKNHGVPFRAYLNSIKLIFIIWHCMGHNWEDITWEDYCLLRDRLIEIKPSCVDTLALR